jgi:hypothetical protein
MLFQDDDEEAKEVSLVRKRKQPFASISQPNEGGPSINEAKEDKAEPALKKNEEKRKKKRHEDPKPKVNVGEKPSTKKTKVHRTMWSKRINIWRLQKITLLGPRMILNHNQSH